MIRALRPDPLYARRVVPANEGTGAALFISRLMGAFGRFASTRGTFGS